MTTRVIALGFFDGVHRGHQDLLRRTVVAAQALGDATACVLLFDRHPKAVLTGAQVPLLNTLEGRRSLIRRCPVRDIQILNVTREFLAMPWMTYLQDFLVNQLGAVHLVAGFNHTFGAKGEGNSQRLAAFCAANGLGCDILPPVLEGGEAISSSRIRALFEAEDFPAARAMLGHPHVISGTVTHGRQIGSKLGYPTVNLTLQPDIVLPPRGVYASWVEAQGGRYQAVTNIGTRPTFDNGAVTIESFLLDFDGDLYEAPLRLHLHAYLRGEQAFPSPAALAEEIGRNIGQAKALLSGQEGALEGFIA